MESALTFPSISSLRYTAFPWEVWTCLNAQILIRNDIDIELRNAHDFACEPSRGVSCLFIVFRTKTSFHSRPRGRSFRHFSINFGSMSYIVSSAMFQATMKVLDKWIRDGIILKRASLFGICAGYFHSEKEKCVEACLASSGLLYRWAMVQVPCDILGAECDNKSRDRAIIFLLPSVRWLLLSPN